MHTSFFNMLATLQVFLLLCHFDWQQCQAHSAYQTPLYKLCVSICAGNLYITDTKVDFYLGPKMGY